MEDIKRTVAQNLVALRTERNMTQLELAQLLNYTDKAVSKWERAESLPDVSVLKSIAAVFGVTVDYLLTGEHEEPDEAADEATEDFEDFEEAEEAEGSEEDEEDDEAAPCAPSPSRNKETITWLSVLLVLLIATFTYVLIALIGPNVTGRWLVFVYAVPVALVVWLVFNSVWFLPRRNYLIVSLLMWAVVAAVHLSFLAFGKNIRLIYLVCLPGQLIILLWSRIQFHHK